MFEEVELGTEAGRSNVGILVEALGKVSEDENSLELEETPEAKPLCITIRHKLLKTPLDKLLCFTLRVKMANCSVQST